MSTVFPDAPHDAVIEQAVANMRRSLAALGSAASAIDLPASPQMARGVQATENAWRAMDAEFGLLSGSEVARLLGSKARSAAGFAADRRKAGKLLGIRRRNAFVYPGFQFDLAAGAVLPVIPALLELVARYGKSPEGLAQWLCARTGQLGDERPVDHLHEVERVLEAAGNHYGVEW
jgi:hypothetical protein